MHGDIDVNAPELATESKKRRSLSEHVRVRDNNDSARDSGTGELENNIGPDAGRLTRCDGKNGIDWFRGLGHYVLVFRKSIFNRSGLRLKARDTQGRDRLAPDLDIRLVTNLS